MENVPLNLYLVKFNASYNEYKAFIVAAPSEMHAHGYIHAMKVMVEEDVPWDRLIETIQIGTAALGIPAGIIDSWFYYG